MMMLFMLLLYTVWFMKNLKMLTTEYSINIGIPNQLLESDCKNDLMS